MGLQLMRSGTMYVSKPHFGKQDYKQPSLRMENFTKQFKNSSIGWRLQRRQSRRRSRLTCQFPNLFFKPNTISSLNSKRIFSAVNPELSHCKKQRINWNFKQTHPCKHVKKKLAVLS